VPSRQVVRTARFDREAEAAFATLPRGDDALRSIEWSLSHGAELGQRVRGTRLLVWPLFPGDGYVYVVYYLIESETTVVMHSLMKRVVPVSPGMLDLEPD
jgi:hypothetical protein